MLGENLEFSLFGLFNAIIRKRCKQPHTKDQTNHKLCPITFWSHQRAVYTYSGGNRDNQAKKKLYEIFWCLWSAAVIPWASRGRSRHAPGRRLIPPQAQFTPTLVITSQRPSIHIRKGRTAHSCLHPLTLSFLSHILHLHFCFFTKSVITLISSSPPCYDAP